MLDPERVGTCIAGAEVIGQPRRRLVRREVTVKLGPVKMTYRARSRSSRATPRHAPPRCSRRAPRTRGQGTAQATLAMAVTGRDGGGSHVKVAADMLVTGRVAQMGRGRDAGRRPPHDRSDGAGTWRPCWPAERPSRPAMPSRPDPCSARWSPIARSASSALRATSDPLAALGGLRAAVARALRARGAARRQRQRRRLLRLRTRRASRGRSRGGRTRSSTASIHC